MGLRRGAKAQVADRTFVQWCKQAAKDTVTPSITNLFLAP